MPLATARGKKMRKGSEPRSLREARVGVGGMSMRFGFIRVGFLRVGSKREVFFALGRDS